MWRRPPSGEVRKGSLDQGRKLWRRESQGEWVRWGDLRVKESHWGAWTYKNDVTWWWSAGEAIASSGWQETWNCSSKDCILLWTWKSSTTVQSQGFKVKMHNQNVFCLGRTLLVSLPRSLPLSGAMFLWVQTAASGAGRSMREQPHLSHWQFRAGNQRPERLAGLHKAAELSHAPHGFALGATALSLG